MNKAILLIADTGAIAKGEERECLGLLSETEYSYLSQLRSPERSRSYLVGRTLLRRALAEIGDRPAKNFIFDRTANGKPFLRRLPGDPDIRFNLSHTARKSVLAIAEGMEIGVDTESPSRLGLGEAIGLVDDHFSEAEATLVRQETHLEHQRQLFLRLWVAKEAALKAIGSGLEYLDKTIVDLDAAIVRVSAHGQSHKLIVHEDNIEGCHVTAAAERPLVWSSGPVLHSLFLNPLIKRS